MIDLGSRRELFVDRFLIDHCHNATMKLNEPVDAGVAVTHDKKWEGDFSFYATVLPTDTGYRLYYRGWPVKRSGEFDKACTCIANSRDGIKWTRPTFSKYKYKAAKNNIIMMDSLYTHNFAPMLDTRPGVPKSERYKALAGTSRYGLSAFASSDGVNWKPMHDSWVLPPFEKPKPHAYDSQNIAFWSEHEQCYVAYVRTNENRLRRISRATSDDFINWTELQEMQYEGGPAEHFYVNQTFPYHRAPHIYIALAARFLLNRPGMTEEQATQIGCHPKYRNETSDTVFITSRGGLKYDRTFMESYMRAGLGYENWSSRTNYAVHNIVQTSDTELSIYMSMNYAQPTAHIRRFTLPLDRFASVNAGYGGGEFVTKPFTFSGKALELNYATSAAGSLRVEVQGIDGKPIEGYTQADCDEILGNELARTVTWKGKPTVSKLTKQPIRLRFAMKDADVFAMRFVPKGN